MSAILMLKRQRGALQGRPANWVLLLHHLLLLVLLLLQDLQWR